MRQYRVKLVTIFLLLLVITGLQAQETIATSGGNGSGVGGNVSYTIGQVGYTNNHSEVGSMTLGVQQPYEFFAVGIDEFKGISLELSAYPNPVQEFILLKMKEYNSEIMTYQLFDMYGKLLINKRIEGDETKIVMSNFTPSIFILRVMLNNEILKVFKIIKNREYEKVY